MASPAGGREGRAEPRDAVCGGGRVRLPVAVAGIGVGAGLVCLLGGVLFAGGLRVTGVALLTVGLAGAGVGGAWVGRQWRAALLARAAAEAERAARGGALAHARDELAVAHRRLGEAERLATVGTMSAQIAHQLRNPLTSVGLYVQLLEDEVRSLAPPKSREASELLELVVREVRTLVEITDNYLQYARLPELEPVAVDMNATVEELARFLRHELVRKRLTLSSRLASDMPPIEADPRLLRFALMNLLKNAVEATEEGGRLRVRTCRLNGAVEVHVCDTGRGIAPEEQGHIFEPFYTTKDAGSGLGLSLSRQIVEKHEGTLTCESIVGVGTTFVVRLPAARPEDRRTPDVCPQPDGAGG